MTSIAGASFLLSLPKGGQYDDRALSLLMFLGDLLFQGFDDDDDDYC